MIDVGAPKLSEESTAAPRPIRRISGEWVGTCADNAAESELVADPRTSLNGAQTFTRFRAMEIRGNLEHDLQSTTPVWSSHQCDRWPFKLFLDLGAPYTVREVAILTRKRELEGVGYSGILIEVASYNETTTWPGVFHEVYRNEAMFGSTSGGAVEFNRTEPSYKLGEFFAHAFSAVANIRFVRISFGWRILCTRVQCGGQHPVCADQLRMGGASRRQVGELRCDRADRPADDARHRACARSNAIRGNSRCDTRFGRIRHNIRTTSDLA
jgi:hypothetical protein